jgi:hypothetical protein
MGSSVSVEDVKAMDPDVVVVATGARGGTLRADKKDSSVPVFDIFSAMDRPAGEWIGEVAMLGGDHASCHTAPYLTRQGIKVHIITSAAALADDKAPITALFLASHLGENDRIVVHAETTAELLTGKRVKIQSKGSVSELSVDAVVIGGSRPTVWARGGASTSRREGDGLQNWRRGVAAQRVLGQPRGCGCVGEDSTRLGAIRMNDCSPGRNRGLPERLRYDGIRRGHYRQRAWHQLLFRGNRPCLLQGCARHRN